MLECQRVGDMNSAAAAIEPAGSPPDISNRPASQVELDKLTHSMLVLDLQRHAWQFMGGTTLVTL
jgi:hypothetical protein